MSQKREEFRNQVFDRENGKCIVPWCTEAADDAHHILERDLWDNGGYIPKNGAGVCNHHHQYAESNDIPPQAFWRWVGIQDPPTPNSIDDSDVDKWGDRLESPPWEEYRDRIKYQSTRHALPLYWYDKKTTADERMEHDDTGLESLDCLVGKPLVITHKMDGSNCMLVSDMDNPVRARNGSSPEDIMKPLYKRGGLYWRKKCHKNIPDNLQVFGEWMFVKHSIHYGCDCENECEDVGPNLSDLPDIPEDESAYFQVFGVFDKEYNIWLSWPETKEVASRLGFPTTPEIYVEDDNDRATFSNNNEARQTLIKHAREVIENGGEGIVVRSKFPFHYGQFGRRVSKYVRENHVKTRDKHWKHVDKKFNQIGKKIPSYFSI